MLGGTPEAGRSECLVHHCDLGASQLSCELRQCAGENEHWCMSGLESLKDSGYKSLEHKCAYFLLVPPVLGTSLT